MSRDRLAELLDAAVKLELATIPPYLCALYSLQPEHNREASLVLRSVVVEEMLHMVLAANVLNAIGGRPSVAGPENAPRFPHELPDGVVLDLLPFSPRALDAFLCVENPQYRAASSADPSGGTPTQPPTSRSGPHPSVALNVTAGPTTIGAFYDEIIDLLEAVTRDVGEAALFCGDPGRQITGELYYAGGGAPVVVTDLVSATVALREVIDQGEGEISSPYDADGDLAHYYRFEQLKHDRAYLRSDRMGTPTGPPVGVDFAAVYPMIPNPRPADLADPELIAAAERADRLWSRVLLQIDAAFDGSPATLVDAVQTMFRLRDAMLVLLANPLPGSTGLHAGPTFDWAPPEPSAATGARARP
jgi:hypothetical protein